MRIDTPQVEPKVKAGAKSVMASAPGALVFIWLLGQTGLIIPPEIAVAIGSLVSPYLKASFLPIR